MEQSNMDPEVKTARQLEEGKGIIFFNAEKKSEKHPDINGRFNYHGEIIQFVGWIREHEKGKLIKLAINKNKS